MSGRLDTDIWFFFASGDLACLTTAEGREVKQIRFFLGGWYLCFGGSGVRIIVNMGDHKFVFVEFTTYHTLSFTRAKI